MNPPSHVSLNLNYLKEAVLRGMLGVQTAAHVRCAKCILGLDRELSSLWSFWGGYSNKRMVFRTASLTICVLGPFGLHRENIKDNNFDDSLGYMMKSYLGSIFQRGTTNHSIE